MGRSGSVPLGANLIVLLAVLGGTPPKKVTINELTTVASVFAAAQFLARRS